MPQFDPTWFVSQIVWLVLVFGALYWLMVKRALPKVAKALDARAERIQGDLDRAAKLQRDAEITAETYEAAIAKARDESKEGIVYKDLVILNKEVTKDLLNLNDRT